ncbi:unnamed protein product, partial [Discosporangium mesarthrocarpum]
MKLLCSLQSANAFSLAELPPGRKAVGAKWVFKWKIDEIFVRFPPGCGDLSGKTVRLHRAFYGCKQSSRAWNMHLTATLKSFGFEQSEADPCLFRYIDEEEVSLLIVTHVDDMIAAGSVGDCDALCEALSTEFPTNLGPLSWYTG